ncbi:MAG: DMT family transporter, partial [Primorskyibacter sp.]
PDGPLLAWPYIALMAVAVLFFTLIDSTAKWLILAGLPVLQVVFARYAGHFLYAAIYYARREGWSGFRSRAPWRQALRSGFLMGSTTCNFIAVEQLPLTVTTTIFFAMPVVITLMAIPILGERPGIRRISAVCLGFCGVLIVVQPWGAAWHPAMVFSLCALLMASSYFIMTRALAGIEGEAVSQLWPSGLAASVMAPLVWPLWIWPEGMVQWGVFLLIGGFGWAGHALANIAHRMAGASLLAPLVYTQIVWATGIGIFVFATWPTVWTLLGGAVIIGSGLYIWQRERVLDA